MEINKEYIDIAMDAPITVDDKVELLALIQEQLFDLFDEDKISEEHFKDRNKYAYDVARSLLKSK